MTTTSGVSSIIISTPVRFSRVRILRPSRPMIRPFMSSEGSETVVTVLSDVNSVALRWIADTTYSFAFLSAVRFASSSILLMSFVASKRTSSSSSFEQHRFRVLLGKTGDPLEFEAGTVQNDFLSSSSFSRFSPSRNSSSFSFFSIRTVLASILSSF